jgi:hypothetical protein
MCGAHTGFTINDARVNEKRSGRKATATKFFMAAERRNMQGCQNRPHQALIVTTVNAVWEIIMESGEFPTFGRS